MDPAALERFQREVQAASALTDPRVCTVHDCGRYDGQPYFVMELLQGQSLRERLAAGPLAWPELMSVAAQTAGTLEAAHENGILHRDVKPANIFLLESGQVKVLDFGLAKLRIEPFITGSGRAVAELGDSIELTRAGIISGTIAYSSPEQLRATAVDAKSDIFSFGIVLYEMATGQRPFTGDTCEDVIYSVLSKRPERPSAISPGVDRGLEQIILKCLEKVPAKRYGAVTALLEDLETVDKRVRRRAWSVRAGIAGVLLLLLAALGTWVGVHESRMKWARGEALPRARLLAASGDVAGALGLARQAERYLGTMPRSSRYAACTDFPWPFAHRPQARLST